jgi:hypothetical protein
VVELSQNHSLILEDLISVLIKILLFDYLISSPPKRSYLDGYLFASTIENAEHHTKGTMANYHGGLVDICESQGVSAAIQSEREVTQGIHIGDTQSLVHQLHVRLSLLLTTLEQLLTPPYVSLWRTLRRGVNKGTPHQLCLFSFLIICFHYRVHK